MPHRGTDADGVSPGAIVGSGGSSDVISLFREAEDTNVSTMASDLGHVIARELDGVAEEISAYRDERNLWVTQGAQRNAPGTLALHLAGNLQHYVGAGLGATGYVRDRPAEFHDRDVPRDVLLQRLADARDTVLRVLSNVPDKTLRDGRIAVEVPEAYRDLSPHGYLVHLTWHLGWHQGQIYYHRLAVEPPEAS